MKKYIIMLLLLSMLIVGCTTTQTVEKIVEVPYNCSAHGYITNDEASILLNNILRNYSQNSILCKQNLTIEDFK